MKTPTIQSTKPAAQQTKPLSVAVVTLGCARNDVDSEELSARLEAGGFSLVAEPADADTVLVNTCGFVESAKKDSIDTLLAASDLKSSGKTQAVVAVGCLAERYGKDLAESLPEADAILGFDDYPDIAARLTSIVAGEAHQAHVPADRRRLLPLSPVDRAPVERVQRKRADSGPMAPLKLASGCDRRCTFCAIPTFRGSFVSRRPTDVVADAHWLASEGARELFLVSENSTSYGKDLGDLRLLETLLPQLADVDGVDRIRVSYLQPAETRPGLLQAIAATPGVAPYFDLSFQHASGPLLRRMRRFGDAESFLGLIDQVRAITPTAGIRSNVIVGFPGETQDDFDILCGFLERARMDVVGVFGYSDEDGTEAVTHADKLDEDQIRDRVEHLSRLVEELTTQRAAERIGETAELLVESINHGRAEGRTENQGPEVDGTTSVPAGGLAVGDLVPVEIVASEGVDLLARAVGPAR